METQLFRQSVSLFFLFVPTLKTKHVSQAMWTHGWNQWVFDQGFRDSIFFYHVTTRLHFLSVPSSKPAVEHAIFFVTHFELSFVQATPDMITITWMLIIVLHYSWHTHFISKFFPGIIMSSRASVKQPYLITVLS